jgi:dUTP pyrophosphatase
MPTKGSAGAAAFDLYMPEPGMASGVARPFSLGFAAAVPTGHVALLLPRSSSGAKFGLDLNNTCGVIDSDYRGEWKAFLRTKDSQEFAWKAGDRVLQFLIVPVYSTDLILVNQLSDTDRGIGGFGSTGQ